jgi:hypothetical protein
MEIALRPEDAAWPARYFAPTGCGRSPEGTAKSLTRTENEARWRSPCPLSAEAQAPPARRTEGASQSCFSASFDARVFFPKSGR